MKKLERSDLMDYVEYEEKREQLRANINNIKKYRRIFLGEKLLIIFENTEMVRDHVLETIRLEKLFSEHELLRLLDVFNPLIPGPGELSCTLIILNEIEWERTRRIQLWQDLAKHIYLVLDNRKTIYATAPEVVVINQYPCSFRALRFNCGDHYPVKIGSDYNVIGYRVEEKLTSAQQKALREDLPITEKEIEKFVASAEENIKEKWAEKAAEKVAERAAEKAVEKFAEKAAEKVAERAAEKAEERRKGRAEEWAEEIERGLH